jgi:hypothetical protein
LLNVLLSCWAICPALSKLSGLLQGTQHIGLAAIYSPANAMS